jgi:hypothetical protein
MKVFVIDGYNCEFFKSLNDIESFLEYDINTDLREKVETEGCTHHIYHLEGDREDILEFDFDDEEQVTFMKCEGPSSECCFLIKKSNLDFFIETSDYMIEAIKSIREEGDRMVVINTDCDNYYETKYQYYDCNGPTDLMSFNLIEVKWYTNVGYIREHGKIDSSSEPLN